MDSWPKSGDGRRLMFRAAKPHFFKIILDDTIRRRKLVSVRLLEPFLFWIVFFLRGFILEIFMSIRGFQESLRGDMEVKCQVLYS